MTDYGYNAHLKAAVHRARKRQLEVAAKAGISNSRFSEIITGRRLASEAEKAAIARVLRRPVADLFPGESEAASA